MPMKFQSKFAVDDLVEYKQDRNDEKTRFGHIREVSFRRSDAVNFVATYVVECCNAVGVDPTHDSGIYEYNIIRAFREKENNE